MLNFKRPMLAASLLPPTVEHNDNTVMEAMLKLRLWPKIATFKEDGIRGIKKQNLLSRTLKLIPNKSIRDRASKLPAGFDTELSNRLLEYYQIESIVMSEEHPESGLINFYMLDWYDEQLQYISRLEKIISWRKSNEFLDIVSPSYTICSNAQELFNFEKSVIEQLGEGICFRPMNSLYVQKNTRDNRSTLSEETLVKLARYVRQEVIVLSLYEQMENTNPRYYNGLGMMDRSSSKDNLIGKNTLGGFHVRSIKTGLEFDVGTGVGLTDILRKEIWLNQNKYIGTTRVIKFKPHGQKIKPRSPIDCGPRKEGY